MNSELGHEILQVGTDRISRQLEPLCDLLSSRPLDQVKQDVPFALGEGREQFIAAMALILIRDQQP